MLQQYLEHRLRSLQSEFEAGQTMLSELEAKQANLRETLLRISGAIQVIEECLQANPDHRESYPVSDILDAPPESGDAL